MVLVVAGIVVVTSAGGVVVVVVVDLAFATFASAALNHAATAAVDASFFLEHPTNPGTMAATNSTPATRRTAPR